MKKFLISVALIPILAASAYAEEVPVRLNQSEVLLEMSAVSENGKILLPLHDIAYATGERLRYSSDNETAYLTTNGIETACFYTNAPDKDFKLDQYSAKEIDGAIYITPESFVKIFGGSVAWDKKENIVDITEKNYHFGLEAIRLFRPAETLPVTDKSGNVTMEVYEAYSENMKLIEGIQEYTKEVTEGRIPVVSLDDTYYGIDYSITQAFKNRPAATITLVRGDETYVYTIHFKECAGK